MAMKKDNRDALNVVSQICGEYSGNLKEHQKIQTALLVIGEALEEPEEENEKN